MPRALCNLFALAALLFLVDPQAARAVAPGPELVIENDGESDAVGDRDGTAKVATALDDTIWIADWTFDASCSAPGWTTKDLRRSYDGTNFWCISTEYAGAGGPTNIVNKAAVLKKHDPCWVRDGYGNNWDYSLILKYRGGASGGGSAPTLTFKFVSDGDGVDGVTVECDSLGLSNSRVDYGIAPAAGPEAYRDQIFSTTGLNNPGTIATALQLVDYTPG